MSHIDKLLFAPKAHLIRVSLSYKSNFEIKLSVLSKTFILLNDILETIYKY